MNRKHCGLSALDVDEITRQLIGFPEVEEVILFGSRAKGTHKPGSDVDLALLGEKIDSESVNQIYDALDERTRLPYFFDVIAFESITNRELIEHIHRVGISIYQRKSTAPN